MLFFGLPWRAVATNDEQLKRNTIPHTMGGASPPPPHTPTLRRPRPSGIKTTQAQRPPLPRTPPTAPHPAAMSSHHASQLVYIAGRRPDLREALAPMGNARHRAHLLMMERGAKPGSRSRSVMREDT